MEPCLPQLFTSFSPLHGAVTCLSYSNPPPPAASSPGSAHVPEPAPPPPLLASGAADYTVSLHDGSTLRPLTSLHGHVGVVTSLCFSACGRKLASASDCPLVRVWDGECGGPAIYIEASAFDSGTGFGVQIC